MDREASPDPERIPQERSGMLFALKHTTFRSLRHRNYRLYFLGQIVSFAGSWMQSAALMWLIYDRTHDLRWPSYLLVAQVGPTVLFGAWGGNLADRSAKRRLVFRTQLAFLVNAVALTVLVGSGMVLPWLILVLQIFNGLVQAIDLPARLAFLSDLVPKEDLINAVGLNSLLFNSARAIGPAVAGLLFLAAGAIGPLLPFSHDPVTFGAACCFALNAVSFVAVLVALHGIRVPGDAHRDPEANTGSSWDGVRYLWDHTALGGLVFATLMVCIFAWPALTLFPGYTRERLGQAQESYSFLVSALGAGALVAALATATVGHVARRAAFLVLGVSATALGIFGLAATTDPPMAMACAAGLGFGLILFLSTGQSTLQLAVPDEVRGRVMAIWAMTLSASAPIGHLLAGQAAQSFGVETVLSVMSGVTALLALGLLAIVVRRGLWK